jgi:CO/xanthine dehydrogenase Mo-binding subunit
MHRRHFLMNGAALGSGAWLALVDAVAGVPVDPESSSWRVSAWLSFDLEGRATIEVHKSEMGQGVLTALPMLIAEELELPVTRVIARLAPAAAEYRDARGNQTTGYSSSISGSWLQFRRMGAAARAMLEHAAASRWGVPPTEVSAKQGAVWHLPTARHLDYSTLLAAARLLRPPDDPPLKAKSEFNLIGRSVPRVDTLGKVDGSDRYGFDIALPGMRVAMLVRSPDRAGQPRHLDTTQALRTAGVERVVTLPGAVAVLARDSYAALRGRDALQVAWPRPVAPLADTPVLRRRLRRALDGPGRDARRVGDVPPRIPIEHRTGTRLVADYHTPFLAHAALEPLACTAWVRRECCELWLGTQAPSRVQDHAARITGLPREKIVVHALPIGGAFGRRGEWDYVVEALEIARQCPFPVKVIWSRADDMQFDFYRPMTAERWTAQLDSAGVPAIVTHRVAGSSITRRRSPDSLRTGTDFLLTQGSSDMHYQFAALHVDYREVDLGVPVGFWRSVGHSHTGFTLESFVDEMAHAARLDPLAFRLKLLGAAPRMRQVLERVARAAGWGRELPVGMGLGIACMESYGSFVAQVAEVSVTRDALRVTDVWCAVDCGIAVHPGIIEQQMHSGILFGLSAALYGEITLRDGRVEQSNFHDYPVLRMAEAPRIHVEIVASDAAPGGCGEPATPVIAPAVANALFAATGRRLRRLPLRLDA